MAWARITMKTDRLIKENCLHTLSDQVQRTFLVELRGQLWLAKEKVITDRDQECMPCVFENTFMHSIKQFDSHQSNLLLQSFDDLSSSFSDRPEIVNRQAE